MKQRPLIDGLVMLDAYFGHPKWFWPVVMFAVFVALPLLASYVEQAA